MNQELFHFYAIATVMAITVGIICIFYLIQGKRRMTLPELIVILLIAVTVVLYYFR